MTTLFDATFESGNETGSDAFSSVSDADNDLSVGSPGALGGVYGVSVVIDDTNVAACIDLWPIIKGEDQNIPERERHLNLPGWQWFEEMTTKGELPIIRDERQDKSIKLEFGVPKDQAP